MSLFHWKKLSSEIKAENPWWIYRIDHFLAPKENEVLYHIVTFPGTVIIVGLDEHGSIPLVRQFRPLFNCETIEFPAGRIDDQQSPLLAARIEFSQEANLIATNMTQIGKVMISPGMSDAWTYVFLATDLVLANDSVPDKTEEFEHVRYSPSEIDSLIMSGAINDSLAISAWTLAKPHILALLDQENITR